MYPMIITLNIKDTAEMVAVMSALSGADVKAQPEKATGKPKTVVEKAAPLAIVTDASAEEKKPAAGAAAQPSDSSKAVTESLAATNKAESTTAETSASTAVSDSKAKVEDAAPAVTYEEVSKAIVASVKTKGKPAVLKVLADFGATKGPEVKPESYGAFLTSLAVLPDQAAVEV